MPRLVVLAPVLWLWFVLFAQVQPSRVEDCGDCESVSKVIDCLADIRDKRSQPVIARNENEEGRLSSALQTGYYSTMHVVKQLQNGGTDVLLPQFLLVEELL